MIGYKTKVRVLRRPRGKQTLQIVLYSNNNEIGEVTVTGTRIQSGQTQELKKENIKNLPSVSGNAVEDLIQSQAGVSTHSELSSQYNVRGGSFEENQITIEGEDAPEDSASTSSSESTSSPASVTNQNSDLNFKEQFVGESFGRINKAEAELTLLTLAEYFTKIGKQRVLSESIDVGIISPYRAQVQYLKKLIKKYEFFKPYRRLISVNTVDGFQGQERDVILISLVRSNDEGQIGFLKDLRRCVS